MIVCGEHRLAAVFLASSVTIRLSEETLPIEVS